MITKTKLATRVSGAALAVLLLAVGCGDDTDTSPLVDGPTMSPDSGTDGSGGSDMGRLDSGAGSFSLEVTVDMDQTALQCDAGAPAKDCHGPLAWLVVDGLDLAKSPKLLAVGALASAKKGSVVMRDKVPLAKTMYLVVYIDDNSSATPQNLWPDRGDPVHIDLKPFTAVDGQQVKRTVKLWARVP